LPGLLQVKATPGQMRQTAAMGRNVERIARRGSRFACFTRCVMNQIIRVLTGMLCLVAGTVAAAPWMDAGKTPEERTALLLEAMTLEEKIAMMHGVCRFEVPGCGFTIGKIPANERLGIPALHLTDGPAGVRNGQPATSFPAPVAIAASWNPELAYRVAVAIGQETLARGQDVLLSPMINLVRVPLAGRNFETFGEDPLLLARMGVAHIRGVQDQGVMADAKHYIMNNQEWDRRRMTVTADERTLRELYLPAFAAAISEGGVATFMCSYNRVDGVHACHNPRLLRDILRGELGFDGFVMTDWNALRDSNATPQSAVAAGLNVVMPWPKGDVYGPPWADGKPVPGPEGNIPEAPLAAAVRAGTVDESAIDALVADTLRAMFRFGLFERSDGPIGIPDFAGHREISRTAAEQGAVLLKNARGVLPLGASKKVAVIGDRAYSATVGGGGSSAVRPFYEPLAPLAALAERVPAERLRAERGIDELPGAVSIPESAWRGGDGSPGVRAAYFANPELAGEPLLQRSESRLAFDWNRYAPSAAMPSDGWSARFDGTLTVPASAEYELELVRAGAARAGLDDRLLFDEDSWVDGDLRTYPARLRLEAGVSYRVRAEFADRGRRNTLMKLGWRRDDRDMRQELFDAAVAAARDSDVAVVFVGTPASEGRDRPSLSLGEDSDRLVSAVAAANPNTVVVVKAGAPVAMPWADDVAAILLTWYPGQEDGPATANLLLGNANPAGRLPVTFARRLEDYPANTPRQYPGIAPPDAPDESWREAVYSEGVFVGYRHFDRAGIEPLFPFGHGLSYTTFEWADARIEAAADPADWRVSLTVRNTGSRAGAEVVQLYVAPPGKAVPRPPKELRGFARVELAPGESRRIEIPLPRRSLAYWDTDARSWRVEDGEHRFLLGASSRDIRLQGAFQVSE
jgi:beta-glucosidase